MPYQGADYIPPSSYGSSRSFPNGQHMGQVGQVQGGQGGNAQIHYGNGQTGYHQPPPPPGSAYGSSMNHSQTAYSTPQYYGQGQSSSFYQTPTTNLQYQQYVSPPNQTAQLPQQYSPAPLQYYQQAPQPHRGTPSQPQQYRQSQPQPQPQVRRSQAARPVQNIQWTSPSVSQPVSTSVANAIPQPRRPQTSQQSSSQQRPYQHRAAPTPGQSAKAHPQTPAQPAAARPPSQQRFPSTSSQQKPSSASSQQRTAPHSSQGHSAASATRLTQSIPLQQTPRTPSQPQQHQSTPAQPMTIDPSVLQRKVARVEIPIQKSSINAEQSPDMPRSPKRRRSNDGKPIPICDEQPAVQRHSVSSQQPKQPPPYSSNAKEARPSQMSHASQAPSIDYQTVLLSLSDEYIQAAYSLTGDLETVEVDEAKLDQYHSLLSAGMGCLDAVLKHYHFSDPRKEARIRLRYASLLHEETENDMVAEEILSKGISICQRAHLTNLQYAMQHLLARIWFKANKPKAAMKAIEKLIIEVEKLNLLHWIYAFRLLRVSLALRKDLTISETMNIIKNLATVIEIANRQNHVSVALVASTLEALVHLRSRTPESVDSAQRAMANARMHQLSNEMSSLPQIKLLLDCIDLGCALTRFNQEQATNKTQAMQNNMDECSRDGSWTSNGTFLLPLCNVGSPAIELERDTSSILRRHHSGESICALPLKWLTRNQVYALGFLLSGLGHMHSNSQEQQAERFLGEGLNVGKLANNHPPQSMSAASSQYSLNRRMRILLRLYVVFAYAGRAEWLSALKGVGNIKEDIKQLGSDPGMYVTGLLVYLEAVCKHGLGDLKGALALYRSSEFKLEGTLDPKSPNVNPVSVLAALNSVPIMRIQALGREAELLLGQITDYCLTHANNNGNDYGSKALESAMYALKAQEPAHPGAGNTIIKTKHYLQSAVAAAKSMSNNRLLAVVMAMMSAMFFGRIIGDQAEKSAKAGRTLARKSQDKLWVAVADGMYSNTLENCGKISEAEGVRQEAQAAMERLPKSLQVALMTSQDN